VHAADAALHIDGAWCRLEGQLLTGHADVILVELGYARCGDWQSTEDVEGWVVEVVQVQRVLSNLTVGDPR
jgi:hypothetical protein